MGHESSQWCIDYLSARLLNSLFSYLIYDSPRRRRHSEAKRQLPSVQYQLAQRHKGAGADARGEGVAVHPDPSFSLEWCYVEVRKTGDGLGTRNTEEMNGPRLRPMAH